MAENRGDSSGDKGDEEELQGPPRTKAIRLLREVTDLLSQESKKEQEHERPFARGQLGASGILGNFRSIFAPYNRPSRTSTASVFQTAKKPFKTKFFQPKETWTHEFFCLALKDQERAPSRAQKFSLQQCGLGRKKICFHAKAQYSEVCRKLEEEFPRLKQAGGFVLMRSGHMGSNTLLTDIAVPASGYSVPFLRDSSGLGQALAYIRPLQRNLDTTPLQSKDAPECGDIVTIDCLNCGSKVPMMVWHSHDSSCGGGSSRDVVDLTPAECDNNFSDEIIGSCDTIQPTTELYSSRNYAATSSLSKPKRGVDILKEMFPDEAKDDLLVSLREHNFELDETMSALLVKNEEGLQVDLKGNSLQELLNSIKPTNCVPHRISIRRDSIMTDSVNYFKKRGFDFDSPVQVTFEGEPAIDGGGPRREYFTMLLKSLLSPKSPFRLFEGRAGAVLPVHNTDALRAHMFKVAGRMITSSIINGGPGFPFFSPVVFLYLTAPNSDAVMSDVTEDDVVDYEVLQAIKKIANAEASEDQLLNVPADVVSLLTESGFPKVLTSENKMEAIATLCVHSVILTRKAELDQLAVGLGPIIKLAKSNFDMVKPLLAQSTSLQSLTADAFRELVVFENVDEKQKQFFLDYIQNEVHRLPDLLMFCTGVQSIPPLGFHDPDKITILQMDEMCGPLPNCSTCSQELEIPSLHIDFNSFREAMNTALDNQKTGFGIV